MIAHIVESVSNDIADSIKQNLDLRKGARAGQEVDLEPLHIWDRLPFTADRTNDDPPLLDTGTLQQSVKVGVPVVSSLPNGGIAVTVDIIARDYGLEQANGGTFRNVYLGRTKELRRMRTFAEAIKGEDYVVKRVLHVPSRPWNDLSEQQYRTIINNAMRRVGA